MGKVHLAFCIYAENPYGNPTALRGEKYTTLFDSALEFGTRLNNCFGNRPRTVACVGSHIEAFVEYTDRATVRKLYARNSEIANHTYSHSAVMPIQGLDQWYPRRILTPQEIRQELQQTATVCRSVFRQHPVGFSAPCGFCKPLKPEIAHAIKAAGCTYSHSFTRGRGGAFFAPLEDQRKLRQPFQYPNGLVEIPLSGWQDVYNFPHWFRWLHRLRFGFSIPKTEQEILSSWNQLLNNALRLPHDIALSYMLHPAYMAGIPFVDRWGISHRQSGYDPDLTVLAQQLDAAKDRGIKIVPMKDLITFGRSTMKSRN
ncbi:MAG TPA: polysaccharide deacetylase family protein [Candidatus Nanoarchaeia archaeon]|nr:polysaccharide deacetylase family protein [Candidatus Nanoarchaeia archaeon]